jgi:hypothetical protein
MKFKDLGIILQQLFGAAPSTPSPIDLFIENA